MAGPGAHVGPYRIEEQIGRGGMGVVYRAAQSTLGRMVALKVISPELAQVPAFRERFRRESRLAAAIDHPNIIPVYEADTVGDVLYIAMRYVDGTDLRAVIQRDGRLDVRRATRIVAQVADALGAAHARQLVHRDVKPANVLITGSVPDEHAYLTDFGLTKHISSDSALTETGQWVGTLDFVAPEQIMGGDVDGRADVYSLGCVLYEAITGQPPFPRDVDVAKIYAHLNEPPPRITDVLPELSDEFDTVVGKALAKDREDRYGTAQEFRAAVLGLTAGREPVRPTPSPSAAASVPREFPPITTSEPETVRLPPPAVATAAPPRRNLRLEAVVMVGVLLLALGAAAAVLAASGVFRSGADSTTAARITEPAQGGAAGPQSAPTRSTPSVVAPRPHVSGGLKPFQTGKTPGKRLPAVYCDARGASGRKLLYCWTPDDGYTIEIPNDGAARRVPDDNTNFHRHPRGYALLRMARSTTGNGFACTSAAEGLTCRSAAGYGFDLPRDVGKPACFGPQDAVIPCER